MVEAEKAGEKECDADLTELDRFFESKPLIQFEKV